MTDLISLGMVIMIFTLPFLMYTVFDSRQDNPKIKSDFEECRTVWHVITYILAWVNAGLFAGGFGIAFVLSIAKAFKVFS